jgi:molybdenum cofactor biosynthesis enzyme MoaA
MLNVPETLIYEVEQIDKGLIPIPKMAVLISNYTCNQKCTYCFFSHMNNGFMPTKETIFDIIKQLNDLGVKAIEFCGGGEPLLTPEIDQIFRKTHDMGMNIGLLTNGVLFKDKIMQDFLERGTYVRFSLDTVSADLYKKIRGTDDLKTVLENIFNALRYKRQNNLDCEISIKIGVSSDIGLKEIEAVYAHFEGWGIDNIQVKNLWNKNGNYFHEEIKKKDILMLNSHNQHIVRKVRYAKYMNEPCWLTPIQITVDGYGDAYLCCYYMHRKDSHKIGNIFEIPYRNI